MLGKDRDAEGERDGPEAPVGQPHVQILHRQPQFLRALPRRLTGGVGKDQEELLTAVAAGEVPAPKACAEEGPYGAQELVSGRVPMGVVERLEVVDVQHDDSNGLSAPLGPLELHQKSLLHVAAVEKLGEGIVDGEGTQIASEPEVGEGKRDMLGGRHGERARLRAEVESMEQTDGLSHRCEGYADTAGAPVGGSMGAGEIRRGAGDGIDAPAPERPAVVRRQHGELRLGAPPLRGDAQEPLFGVVHVQDARRAGEQPGGIEGDHGKRFLRRNAGLQQVARLVEQHDLTIALVELLCP